MPDFACAMQSLVVGDLLSVDRLSHTIVPAPQDLGESKHAALDDEPEVLQESSLPLREIEQTAPIADSTPPNSWSA